MKAKFKRKMLGEGPDLGRGGGGDAVGCGPEKGSLPSLHLPGSLAWVPLGAGGVKRGQRERMISEKPSRPEFP